MSRVLLLLCVFLCVGCPPDDGSVSPTFPDLENTPPPPPPNITPDPSKEKVRACVLLPSSGSAKAVGAEMRRGMAIAQAEVAAQPWRTRAIEWIEQDTKSTEAGAVAAYQRCFAEGFGLMIGPVHPEAATAIMPVAVAHDAVLVIPAVGAAMPSLWGDQIVAIAPPAFSMGAVAAKDIAEGRQLTSAAVLHTPGIFGTSIRDSFVARYETAGGTVMSTSELDPDNPVAWASAALQASVAGAKALFVVGPPGPAEAVAMAMNDDPMAAVHLWLIDWAMFPPVATAAGEGGYKRVHWINRLLPRGEFADTYVTRYQAKPEYAAGDGYDAVIVAANAVEKASTATPFEVAEAARGLEGVVGAFGASSMTKTGDIIHMDATAYRVFEVTVQEVTGNWVFAPPD